MRKRGIGCLLLLLIASLSCGPLFTQQFEPEVSYTSGSCTIDARAILQSLDQGDVNVFVPQLATPGTTPDNGSPVHWSQADYYRIAQALNEFVWQEPLDSWNLNKVVFHLDCADASVGPQRASFHLFRLTKTREADSRLEYSIYIRPLQNQVEWTKAEYYPARWQPAILDLATVRVTAEKALYIAESSGGIEARLAEDNVCTIMGFLGADSRYEGWWVRYGGNNSTMLFEAVIDEQTGDLVIHSENE